LLGGEPLKPAVTDAIVLAEITVKRVKAVVSLAGDDVWLLPLGIALPKDDALMSEAGPNVVERRAPWDDGLGIAFMLG
jgi:hypothetical protein